MIGRILHRENSTISSSAASAADEASVRDGEMDVDGADNSALMSAISSAVCQLGT